MKKSRGSSKQRPERSGGRRQEPALERVFWLAGHDGAPLPDDPDFGRRLVELIVPHVEEDVSIGVYVRFLTLGALAWNLTILPEDEGRTMVAATISATSRENEEALMGLLGELALRKQQLWPDDGRLVAQVRGRLQSDGRLYLEVAPAGKP